MENGAFALWSKCSIFHNLFKYLVFQWRQKALLQSKGSTLCLPGNFSCFLSSADFSLSTSSKNSFMNTIGISNSLDPDQARRFVEPDPGPNCLQRLSADDTSRQRVKWSHLTHWKHNTHVQTTQHNINHNIQSQQSWNKRKIIFCGHCAFKNCH